MIDRSVSDSTAQSILVHQVRAVFDDIDQAQEALTGVPSQSALRDRGEATFQHVLDRRRNDCLELEGRVRGGAPLEECWQEMRDLRGTVASLVVECLSFIQGALAREHGVAARVTALADGLVEDLVTRLPIDWKRFTLIAEREYVGGPAEIIRIRFPETTVWSLPLLAHELGHFVGPRLGHDDANGRRVLPFGEMLAAAARSGPGAQGRLDELFADVFASWTAGPAFAMACLFLRFDPARGPDIPMARHPADVERMRVILRTLRTTPSASPRELVDELEERWGAAVSASGNARAVSAEAGHALDRRTDELTDLLAQELPRAARYAGWARAETLAEGFDAGHVPKGLPSGSGPWDVVNAAWLHRSRATLRPDRSLEDLAAQVHALSLRALPESG